MSQCWSRFAPLRPSLSSADKKFGIWPCSQPSQRIRNASDKIVNQTWRWQLVRKKRKRRFFSTCGTKANECALAQGWAQGHFAWPHAETPFWPVFAGRTRCCCYYVVKPTVSFLFCPPYTLWSGPFTESHLLSSLRFVLAVRLDHWAKDDITGPASLVRAFVFHLSQRQQSAEFLSEFQPHFISMFFFSFFFYKRRRRRCRLASFIFPAGLVSRWRLISSRIAFSQSRRFVLLGVRQRVSLSLICCFIAVSISMSAVDGVTLTRV